MPAQEPSGCRLLHGCDVRVALVADLLEDPVVIEKILAPQCESGRPALPAAAVPGPARAAVRLRRSPQSARLAASRSPA
ncbi:MAG: hypothetical protein WCA12_01605, partial [Burkholderiales bacterium]